MNLGSHALASLYLGQFSPSFWGWSSNGDAIVWTDDGTTIALRAELHEILARIAPRGLPSLSAVVLILAACRDGWREPALQAERRLLGRFQGTVQPALVAQLGVVRRAMEGVAALPAHLRRGVDAKAVLLETILANAARRLTPEEAGSVVDAFGEGAEPAKPGGLVDWAPPTLFELAEDLSAIRAGVEALDAQALELRLRSGLEQAPRPAEVELPDSERVRRLLAFLRDDDDLASLASLARHLLATVQVPRPLASRSDQPVGGVSDISNRGPLHRLLLSELAHDDLTFTVRVSTGEALYLRREAPPRQPSRQRLVLLDTGIRMWGVSRVFATAVGLALVGAAGATARVDVFRPEAGDLVPVDLTTREGLLEHLEALETTPQPGATVARLLAHAASRDDVDVIVVTHGNAAKDPAFERALADAPAHSVYLATVDAGGGYQLEVRGPRGRKTLSRATLDLAPLLAPRDRSRLGDPLVRDGVGEFPAIFSADPFPLRLPARVDARRIAEHPLLGSVAITSDGRLMHWMPRACVARQLSERVPLGELMWLEIDESCTAWVAIHERRRRAPRRLIVIRAPLDRSSVRYATFRPANGTLLEVTRVGPVLALIYGSGLVDAVHLETGKALKSIRFRGTLCPTRGRFFSERGEFYALSWTGTSLALERVPLMDAGSRQVLTVWDRVGEDGPWALLDNGHVIALNGEAPSADRLAERERYDLKALSRNGHRLAIQTPSGRPWFEIHDLRTGRHHRVLEPLTAMSPVAGEILANAPQTRKRFHSIGIDAQGRLTLVSRRDRAVRIAFDRERGHLFLHDTGDTEARLQLLRPFQRVDSPSETRLQLRRATWPSGTCAWLDSRGLLHLQSGAEGLPELTLVLAADGPLAGWTSKGHEFGPAEYVDTDRGAMKGYVLLRQFVERL